MEQNTSDLEEILRRQDEAMALLGRLRRAEPIGGKPGDPAGGGRRDFRRWPSPPGVTIDLHDGEGWHTADCSDMGVGGARLNHLPDWANGPTPARLKGPTATAVLVLTDIMWRDADAGTAGLHFEFYDQEERDLWADVLIDALLAQYSLD
jgi:hypothetical protein